MTLRHDTKRDEDEEEEEVPRSSLVHHYRDVGIKIEPYDN